MRTNLQSPQECLAKMRDTQMENEDMCHPGAAILPLLPSCLGYLINTIRARSLVIM